MKRLGEILLLTLLAGALWAALPQARTTRQSVGAAPASTANACQQEWQAMAQRHREQADAMLKQSSGLRALLTMLRNDAGIVHDSTVRDALQVDADMWEASLANFQTQAASLRALAEQEKAGSHVLCSAK